MILNNHHYIMSKFKQNSRYLRLMIMLKNSITLLVCIVACYNIILIEAIYNNNNNINNNNSPLELSQNEVKCFNCIRNVSSQLANSDVTKRCESYYCGPYQISYTYWSEAGKPGNNQGSKDFEKCARDKSCAEQTVRAYFRKFKRDCNNDGLIDCLDMAALHKAGPGSCSSDWFYKSRYWLAFNKTNCITIESSTSEQGSEQEQYDSFNLKQQQQQQHSNKIMKNQTLTSDCLDCICDAVSGCNTSVSNCGSGAVCGPFAISQAYWKDGRRPGASWTACSRTKECSSVTIKNYMEKYKRDCNDDGFITCEDYAAIHRRGPRACTNKDLFKDHYWNKFLSCRANQMPSKDVNMVKVNENSPPLDDQLISIQQQQQQQQQQQIVTQKQQQPTTSIPIAIISTTTTTTTLPPSMNNYQINNHQQQSAYTTTMHPSTSASPIMSSQEEFNQPKFIVGYHQKMETNNRYEYSQTPSYSEQQTSDDNNSKYQRKQQQPTVRPQTHKTIESDYYDSANRINNMDNINNNNNNNDYINSYQRQQILTSVSLENNSRYPNAHHQQTIFENTRQKQHQQLFDYQQPLILVKVPSSSTSPSTASPITTQQTSTTMTLSTTTTSTTTSTTPAPTIITTTLSSSPIMEQQTVFIDHSASQITRIKQQITDSMQPFQMTTEEPSTSFSNLNQQPTYQGAILDQNHEESSNIEYPVSSEFPNVNGVVGNDRFGGSAFDVVVTNIVGNPEFSKTYPPIPEILSQSGSELNKQTELNNNNEQQLIKSQQIYNTNHSSQPNQANGITSKGDQKNTSKSNNDQQRPQMLSQNNSSTQINSSTTTTNNNNNNPIYQRSTVQQQSSVETNNNNQQQAASNPLYDVSINMTSIFEKSLNETNTRIASECLECICDASSNCDTSVQCISKQREKNRCGLYMISWNQYQESDILLTSLIQTPQGMSDESADEKMYYDCTTDRLCAERLIHLYIEKHQKDCNNDGKIDCYDIAAIHRVGPDNCNSSKFLSSQYWKDFNICYTTDRLTTTVLPQALSPPSSSIPASASSSSSSSSSSSRMLLYR